MAKTKTKSATSQTSTHTDEEKSLKTTVKDGLQNKNVQVSLASIAVLAACGAVGYALTRPSNRRRIARYSDQISDLIPGMSRRSTLPERLSNQIVDLVESALKR